MTAPPSNLLNHLLAWSNISAIIPIAGVVHSDKITASDKRVLVPLLQIQCAASFMQHLLETDSCNHDMVGFGYKERKCNISEYMEYAFLYTDRIVAWSLGTAYVYILNKNDIPFLCFNKKLTLLLTSLGLITITDTFQMTPNSYAIVHSLWHLSIYTYLGWIVN